MAAPRRPRSSPSMRFEEGVIWKSWARRFNSDIERRECAALAALGDGGPKTSNEHATYGEMHAGDACSISYFGMFCRDLRRWMKDLEQGCVDLWGAYGDVFRITTMVVALLFILHNSVLCTLHVLYRHRIAQVEFWGLVWSVVWCAWVFSRMYVLADLDAKQQRRVLVTLLRVYLTSLVISSVISAQPGRTRDMAMLNATLLCITSFMCIRGILDKAIVNLLPCFSWHFWKRSLPWLQAERGTDLGLLLFVMLLYSFSVYLSVVTEPEVSTAIQRSRSIQRSRRRRGRETSDREEAAQQH